MVRIHSIATRLYIVCSSRYAICTGRAKSTTTIPFVELFMVAQQLFAGCVLAAWRGSQQWSRFTDFCTYQQLFSQKSPVLHKPLSICVLWLYHLVLLTFTINIDLKSITFHNYTCTVNRKTLGDKFPCGSTKRSQQHMIYYYISLWSYAWSRVNICMHSTSTQFI